MKQKVLSITEEEIDLMIRIKCGCMVSKAENPAFLSNWVIGQLFNIDGSSVRRLYIKRF